MYEAEVSIRMGFLPRAFSPPLFRPTMLSKSRHARLLTDKKASPDPGLRSPSPFSIESILSYSKKLGRTW